MITERDENWSIGVIRMVRMRIAVIAVINTVVNGTETEYYANICKLIN